MIPQSQPLPGATYRRSPPADLPGWAEDEIARIGRANVETFRAAGVGADTDTDEAAVALLAHLRINTEEMDADIAEMVLSAAEKQFRQVRRALYAALDAAAEGGA